MAQFLEMTFLGAQKIERDDLMATLVEEGLAIRRRSEELHWMTWTLKGQAIDVSATSSHGLWNKHFIEVGFDSNVLRNLAVRHDRKAVIDEFLGLGRHLWTAFPFFEGILAAEDTGALLYGFRQSPAEEIRKALPAYNYARFLSADAVSLPQIQQWFPHAYPFATIEPLPPSGSLVIWDTSEEGLARFLSEGFSIA